MKVHLPILLKALKEVNPSLIEWCSHVHYLEATVDGFLVDVLCPDGVGMEVAGDD